MPNEVFRYSTAELFEPGHEYVEQSPDLAAALEQINMLYRTVQNLPAETRDVIQQLCVAQQSIIEEQLHAKHPEGHPQENMAGGQYSHRSEATGYLKAAMAMLSKRDIRTIDISRE